MLTREELGEINSLSKQLYQNNHHSFNEMRDDNRKERLVSLWSQIKLARILGKISVRRF
jgi:hypothetical protein